MANNRMTLVRGDGERFLFAKYYPSTNWYLSAHTKDESGAPKYAENEDDQIEAYVHFCLALEKFIESPRAGTLIGDTSYRIEYAETEKENKDGP